MTAAAGVWLTAAAMPRLTLPLRQAPAKATLLIVLTTLLRERLRQPLVIPMPEEDRRIHTALPVTMARPPPITPLLRRQGPSPAAAQNPSLPANAPPDSTG